MKTLTTCILSLIVLLSFKGIEPEKSQRIATVPTQTFNHSIFNNLLQKHVSQEGNVDYKGFKTDAKKLNDYINVLQSNHPTNSWAKKDKLAYWINAYNALTIDL